MNKSFYDFIEVGTANFDTLIEKVDDNTIVGPDSNCNLGFQTEYAYTVKGVKLVPAMTLARPFNAFLTTR